VPYFYFLVFWLGEPLIESSFEGDSLLAVRAARKILGFLRALTGDFNGSFRSHYPTVAGASSSTLVSRRKRAASSGGVGLM